MSDDELLAAIFTRFLNYPGHPADEPEAYIDRGTLWLDGHMTLSDDEVAAVEGVFAKRWAVPPVSLEEGDSE